MLFILNVSLLPGVRQVFSDQKVIAERPELVYHLVVSTVATGRISIKW